MSGFLSHRPSLFKYSISVTCGSNIHTISSICLLDKYTVILAHCEQWSSANSILSTRIKVKWRGLPPRHIQKQSSCSSVNISLAVVDKSTLSPSVSLFILVYFKYHSQRRLLCHDSVFKSCNVFLTPQTAEYCRSTLEILQALYTTVVCGPNIQEQP